MKKIKVLIVEDETIVALELKKELERLDFEVTGIVFTQKKVMDSIQASRPDIILMDINLGKNEDGIEIAKEIYQTYKIHILYLTAFSDDNTMQRAFDTNPIGYIVKPFKSEELKININLAMYKLNQTTDLVLHTDYVSIGENFYFDMENTHLYFKDKFVKLGKKEAFLLSILIEAKSSIVPSYYLEEIIWDGNQLSQSALRTLVYRLKGKLGNNIIEVTYGYGYKLKLP
jgi:two-component system, OmpR family, response regulator